MSRFINFINYVSGQKEGYDLKKPIDVYTPFLEYNGLKTVVESKVRPIMEKYENSLS
jgi:hypothetical protein